MIDGSEKRKRQLVFELQSSRVYEKRSLYKCPPANLYFPHVYRMKITFETTIFIVQVHSN